MARNTKNVLKNITILFLLTAVVFLGYSLNRRAESDAYTANSLHSLAKKVLQTTPKVEKGLRDTFKMIMLKTKHDTIPNPPLTLHDTIDIHNRLEALKRMLFNYGRLTKDSLTAVTREKHTLMSQVAELTAQNKKLSNQPVIHIDSRQSLIDSNADIVVLPFKRARAKTSSHLKKTFGGFIIKRPAAP